MHFYYCLFETGEKEEDIVSKLRLLKAYLGGIYGMFNAILIASRLTYTFKFYEVKGIPRHILVDSMSDLEIWMRNFHKENGVWGLEDVSWLLLHVNGRIFRLGRLQYTHGSFRCNVKVFRSRISGRIAALAESGMKYRKDGEVNGTNSIFDSDAWTSELEINSHSIKGNFIAPIGKAVREPITLPAAKWEAVLSKLPPIEGFSERQI